MSYRGSVDARLIFYTNTSHVCQVCEMFYHFKISELNIYGGLLLAFSLYIHLSIRGYCKECEYNVTNIFISINKNNVT